MDKEQWGVIKHAWEALKDGYEQCKKEYEEVIFHQDRYDVFEKLFIAEYNKVMTRFMKKETVALDAHKQAAIITICSLKANVIEHNLGNKDDISIVPQLIAVNVGLSYMRDCMNDALENKKIGKKIDKYYLPVAIACDTPYIEVICRILYYEQVEKDMEFNVLELADRYFLLDYINLLQRGIEPYALKE